MLAYPSAPSAHLRLRVSNAPLFSGPCRCLLLEGPCLCSSPTAQVNTRLRAQVCLSDAHALVDSGINFHSNGVMTDAGRVEIYVELDLQVIVARRQVRGTAENDIAAMHSTGTSELWRLRDSATVVGSPVLMICEYY